MKRVFLKVLAGIFPMGIIGLPLKAQDIIKARWNGREICVNLEASNEQEAKWLLKQFGMTTTLDSLEHLQGEGKGGILPLQAPLKQVLLLECSGDCRTVWYQTQPEETLEGVAKKLGNVPVQRLQALNRGVALTPLPGQLVVGYLPLALWQTPYRMVKEQKDTSANSIPAGGKQEEFTPGSLSVAPAQLTDSLPPGDSHAYHLAMDLPVTDTPMMESSFAAAYKPAMPVKSQSGKAAPFKSASGWADGRFYVLLNGVKEGKVVEVVNTTNQRRIYAKVLSPLPKIKQNNGLLLRLNSAGFAALGADEDVPMLVELHY